MEEYLILLDNKINRVDFLKDLSKITGVPVSKINGIFGASVSFKWDTPMEDMRRLSKRYKNKVLTLQYIGDKVSTNYREYYFNGKVQVVPVRMTFDEFNKEFLD